MKTKIKYILLGIYNYVTLKYFTFSFNILHFNQIYFGGKTRFIKWHKLFLIKIWQKRFTDK